MRYHVGDRLLCRVNQDGTVIFDVDWSNPKYSQFKAQLYEVIGILRDFYIILVPENITNSSIINSEAVVKWTKIHSKNVQIDPKHFGSHVFLIQEKSIGGREVIDPYATALMCRICLDYFPWAVANQADGSLICWVCRSTRNYK